MLNVSEELARATLLAGCDGEYKGIKLWSYKDASGMGWDWGLIPGEGWFHASEAGEFEHLTAVECLSMVAFMMEHGSFSKAHLDGDTDKIGPIWWWHPKGCSIVPDWGWHPELELLEVPLNENGIHYLTDLWDDESDTPRPPSDVFPEGNFYELFEDKETPEYKAANEYYRELTKAQKAWEAENPGKVWYGADNRYLPPQPEKMMKFDFQEWDD